MSADLHLHVRTPECTDEVMRDFFRNVLGSSWNGGLLDIMATGGFAGNAFDVICNTPDCWIGSVSWLKAAMTNDAGSHVPDPVQVISDIVGDRGTPVTPELTARVVAALEIPNETGYHVADAVTVKAWLEEHAGKPIFCVSW